MCFDIRKIVLVKFNMSLIVSMVIIVSISIPLLQSSLVIANDQDGGKQNDSNIGSRARMLSLLDWSAYQRFFNKRYSSMAQALARQKIFLARVMEVFITGTKYRFYQLSFYTSINKWSDLTMEEREKMVSGDKGDILSLDENKFTDDMTAQNILIEKLRRQVSSGDKPTKERGEAQASSNRRMKRNLEKDNSSLLDKQGYEPKQSRELSVADLILVEEKKEPDPRLHIEWIVPSTNPNYEPIKSAVDEPEAHINIVSSVQSIPLEDIPSDQVEAITEANKSLGPMPVLKSAFSSAIDWWTANKADTSIEKNETIVIRDWRKSGCIGPVHDQGYCASCYAISSMGFVEWALCRNQGNILTPLSVQYMVSCGLQYRDETEGKIKLEGCQHGMSKQTMEFVKEYGIELEVNMPYFERETTCPIAPFTERKKKGYIRPNVKQVLRLAGSTNQLDLALKTGPVIVSMRMPKDFLAYGGGFVEHCDPAGGHAMLVVGNMIEEGVEYLLIKNSFGIYWGYEGYFKFKRSSMEECVKEFIVPVISFPGKKSQARRIKAYLANQQQKDDSFLESNKNDDSAEADDNE